MHIQDSVILVTGRNRGLGKSLIQAFLDAGAKKIYVGSRTRIETSDSRLQPIQLDITNEHDIAAAIEGSSLPADFQPTMGQRHYWRCDDPVPGSTPWRHSVRSPGRQHGRNQRERAEDRRSSTGDGRGFPRKKPRCFPVIHQINAEKGEGHE
jgi:hypothetical protein